MMSDRKRLTGGALLLGVWVFAAAGCGAPQPVQVGDTQSVHDRPEPVTGSLIRRDRQNSNVKTVDPDAIATGARGTTATRPGGGG
jgi:hypothetical protein